jgi:hypothetical protein
VVGLAGVTITALVATACLTGLAGLALGSRLADRIGRIRTSAAASPNTSGRGSLWSRPSLVVPRGGPVAKVAFGTSGPGRAHSGAG